MPVFTYKGTNRSGGSVAGEMSASNKNELQSLLRRQQITRHEDVGEGQGIQHAHLRRKRQSEGTGHLHAAILGDDRRRVTAGAVSGNSRDPAGEQDLSRRS